METGGSVLRYDIHEASKITGIEESRIRYFEKLYQDFFNFSEMDLAGGWFDERQIFILRKIHQLMQEEGLSPTDVRNELARSHGMRRRNVRVIAVTSGKGGVGKTTVSVNLAIALQRRGYEALLFDADLGLANVHVLTGMTPKYTIMDLITGRVDADRVLAEGPEQIHMLCGMSGVQELADLDWELTEHVGREIEQIALGFDFVIIDTAAGISSNVIHFLELADEIMVVVTPNTAAILDAYGIVKVAREQQVTGAIDLLLNQVQDDGEAGRVADNICRCTRRFLGYEPGIIGHLLEDPMVEQSIRNRTPLMTSFPDSMNVPLLDDLARKLTDAGRKHRRRGMRPDRLASLFMPFSLETSMHAPGTRG